MGIRGIYLTDEDCPATEKAELVPNDNYQAILMYLQSKDDNILLQIGGFLHSVLISNPSEDFKDRLVILYGG